MVLCPRCHARRAKRHTAKPKRVDLDDCTKIKTQSIWKPSVGEFKTSNIAAVKQRRNSTACRLNMAVCLLWRPRTSIPRPSAKFCFQTTLAACNICSSSTQTSSTSPTIFQPLCREELMTKFKSRLKDRPFTVGSTGEGFPELLGEPRDSLPHGVLVNNPRQSSLAQLTAKCMEYVEENLADYPAILFRNLPAQTAQDFSIIAQGIPWKNLTYEGGTSFRTQIDNNVGTYTANNDPDEITIDPHNEMSYSEVYPSKIFFFCVQEPADGCGGETPLVKNSELLSTLDPDIVRRFEEKQVRYVRYLPNKSNGDYLNWQQVYLTDNREAVERLAKEKGNTITWDLRGDLYLWQVRPACINHPITRKKIWFNQVASLHGSFYRLLPGCQDIPDHKLPSNTYYGDGSIIESTVLQHVLASTWSCAVGFQWRKGDLLVLDNLAVQHGRLGFKGDRQLLVYMTV